MSRGEPWLARRVLLLASLFVPGAVRGQVHGCVSPDRLALFGQEWFTYPQLIAPVGSEYFVSGYRSVKVPAVTAGGLVDRDTMVDGFIARGARPALAVQPFLDGKLTRSARVLERDGDALRVLVEPSRVRDLTDQDDDSLDVWEATYAAGRWRNVRRVVRLAPFARFYRNFTSEVVTLGGRSTIAFMSRLPGSEDDGVAFLHIRGDSAWLEYQDLEVIGGDYADLVVYDGVPWLAVTAIVKERRFEGAYTSKASIWTSRLDGGRWRPLERVVDGLNASLMEPRLIPTRSGLVLTWIEQLPGRAALRWKGVSAGADSTVHQVDSIAQVARGNPPFTHVLVVTTDTSVTALVPLPGGREIIARVSASAGHAGLVGGGWEEPILLAVRPLRRPLVPVELVAFSLKCAVPKLRLLAASR